MPASLRAFFCCHTLKALRGTRSSEGSTGQPQGSWHPEGWIPSPAGPPVPGPFPCEQEQPPCWKGLPPANRSE